MTKPVIPESNFKVVYYGTAAERDAFDTSKLGIGNGWKTEAGDVSQWTGTQWIQTASGGAGLVDINNASIVGTELYEIVPAGTVGAASITTDVWISTDGLLSGMVYAKGDTITGTTAWTLNAHYSFDGISEITSEAIATGTSAVATGAETISVNFNEKIDGADAAGFAFKIKDYPFIKYSLTFTNGTAAGTAECMMKAVRRNG